MNEEHTRMCGHRNKFCLDNFNQSALSMHIYTDHPEHVGESPVEGLLNYNIAILESTSALNLKRRESFYIWATEAEVRHLNRYKIV